MNTVTFFFFFKIIDVDHFKSFLNLLQYCFCFLFSVFVFALRHMRSVPWPVIEPKPPAVEAQSLNHWTAGEFPKVSSCEPTQAGFGTLHTCHSVLLHVRWSPHDPIYLLGSSHHILILANRRRCSFTWRGCSASHTQPLHILLTRLFFFPLGHHVPSWNWRFGYYRGRREWILGLWG